MRKAVMISIKPKWVKLIESGGKTVVIQKFRPKIDVPFKCYIYCTKSDGWYGVQSKTNPAKKTNATGKVVGEFVCDICAELTQDYYELSLAETASCIQMDNLKKYIGEENDTAWCWRISNLKMYDKPKELSDFMRVCNHESDCFTCKYWKNNTYDCFNRVQRAPRSYCFVEEL